MPRRPLETVRVPKRGITTVKVVLKK